MGAVVTVPEMTATERAGHARRLLDDAALRLALDQHVADLTAQWRLATDPAVRDRLWHAQAAVPGILSVLHRWRDAELMQTRGKRRRSTDD